MERQNYQPEYGKNVGEIVVLNECISLLFPYCLKNIYTIATLPFKKPFVVL